MDTVQYEVRDYALAANAETEDFVPAATLRVLSASGPLAIAFGPTAAYQRIESGLSVRVLEPFNHVRIKDLSGAPNAIRIAYAGADVQDSRLTLSGEPLGVKDSGAGAESFSDVVSELQAVVAALREDRQLRAALTTLEGAQYHEAVNTTNTILTAVANTGGAILRFGGLYCHSGSGVSAAIRVDGSELIYCGLYSGVAPAFVRDLYIPSGVSIDLVSSKPTVKTWAWVEAI